jgi:hypothetical protein
MPALEENTNVAFCFKNF